MPVLLGFEFNRSIVGPAAVNGIAQAGLYGLIAVALVLTFRVSRTVAFLHGGLVLMGAIFYWWLTTPNRFGLGGRPVLHPWMGLMIVMVLGGVIAGIYGVVVTGDRMAGWPRVTLTTFSLGIMLLLGGIMFQTIQSEGSHAISPFGQKTFKIFGQFISSHQITILAIIAVVVAVLSVVLKYTRTGIFVRAIADNVTGSRLVGVPINRVGTGIYALSGILSALAGAALAVQIGLDVGGLIGVFLRALMVSVLGGFASLTLALAGALVIAEAEIMMRSGVFGTAGPGLQEAVVFGAIFGAVLLVNRMRPRQGSEALAEGI
jgi:branched-subunit amino acid ABC-type transport system permease component